MLDLTTLPITAGGFCVMTNPAAAAGGNVTWGPDDGAGNIVAAGDLLPGESAVLRLAASQTKYRFKATIAILDIQIAILNP